MKKIIYTLFAFAAVTFVSCNKEESTPVNEQPQPEVELVPMTFTAGVDTKVTLGENNAINWEESDKISIFDGTGNREFTIVKGSITGNTATFTGEVAASATDFVALYPYASEAKYAAGKITGVPLSKTGKFAPVATASASLDNNTLNFTTVIGFVKFKLADAEGVTSVTISGNNGELIGGSISIETGNSIKVTATQPTATVSANSETIYIPVAPATLSKGITISADKKSSISSSKTTTIEANKAFNLNTLPALTSGAPADNYVAYIHGFDLTVGDQKYNINDEGALKATIVTDGNPDVSGTGKAGIYFVDGVISFNTKKLIQESIIISKKKEDATVNLVKMFDLQEGSLSLKEITITCDTDALITASKNSSLILDGCKVTLQGKPLVYSSNAFTFENLLVYNCDIITYTTAPGYVIGCSNATFNNVVINNSLFIPKTTGNDGNLTNETKFNYPIIVGQSADKIDFTNNSVYRIGSGADGYFNITNGINTLSFTKNCLRYYGNANVFFCKTATNITGDNKIQSGGNTTTAKVYNKVKEGTEISANVTTGDLLKIANDTIDASKSNQPEGYGARR